MWKCSKFLVTNILFPDITSSFKKAKTHNLIFINQYTLQIAIQLQLFLYLIFLNIYFTAHNFLIAAVPHCLLEEMEVLAYKQEDLMNSRFTAHVTFLMQSWMSHFVSFWLNWPSAKLGYSISFCLSFFYIGLQISWGSDCLPLVTQHPENGTLILISVLDVIESLFFLINTMYNITFLFSVSVFLKPFFYPMLFGNTPLNRIASPCFISPTTTVAVGITTRTWTNDDVNWLTKLPQIHL